MTYEATPQAWARDTLDLSQATVSVRPEATGSGRSRSEATTVTSLRADAAELVRLRLAEFGFALLADFPLDAPEATAEAFAGFCRAFGDIRAQDGQREHWRFVRDRAPATGVAGTSGSTGSMEIALHTENARPPAPPRFIALLCLRPAAFGGSSLLASGPEILDRLTRDRPECVGALRDPMAFGRRPEDFEGDLEFDLQPVFSSGPRFRFRFSRYWIDLAVNQSGVRLSDKQTRAVEAVDSVLAAPDLPIEFDLKPGQAVVIDNSVVMHGRRAFQDDPAAPRTLVRVWMD